MLAFIPGTQEFSDVLITVIVSVVGSAWGGAWFVVKLREQNFLMKLRNREQGITDSERLSSQRIREEEHEVKMELLKELTSQGRLELTSDGQIRQKR